MSYRIFILTAFALSFFWSATIGAADDKKESPFSLEFSAGAEYDSNVAVLELDTSSGQSDIAGLVDLSLGFDKKVTRKLKVNLGYDFSQSLHEEFDTFDIGIHRGSAGLGYDFGVVETGLTLQYADAALDDAGFLVLKQATPHLSRLFGKKLFVRLAYAHTDKEFPTNPGRDAETSAPSADVFVFVNGVKQYFVFGYEYQDEDAVDDQFDYTGDKIKAQFSHRAQWGSKQVKLKLEARHESREYANASMPMGQPREDRRYRFQTELEVPASKRAFFTARYEYADNQSNLSSVNFDEHVASIRFGARF